VPISVFLASVKVNSHITVERSKWGGVQDCHQARVNFLLLITWTPS